MFQVGEYVVRGNADICKVEDITYLDVSGSNKDKEYYLLVPIYDQGSKIYTPVKSNKSTIRKVITEKEAWNLIDDIPDIEALDIENEKLRETKYKQVLRSCDCRELVGVIKTLYHRKKDRTDAGKKSTVIDDQYFKLAEDSLYGELAFAIGKERDEMQALIAESIKKKMPLVEG